MLRLTTTKPHVHMTNLDKLKDDLIDDLDNYEKDYLIKSIICFLPQSQLEELRDSIDREIF